MAYSRKLNSKNIRSSRDTSWEVVAKKYSKDVGEKGSYFHEHIIVPKSLDLLKLNDKSRLLDLACGQGFFSTNIPKSVDYVGIDLSTSLINYAKKHFLRENVTYLNRDISSPLSFETKFTDAVIILALQNIKDVKGVLNNASKALEKDGKLLIILNHPYYRIPRQSGWTNDETNMIQKRWVSRYMSPMSIPINMTPGSTTETKNTWSFHYPLSYYSKMLKEADFVVEVIEEWCSDKKSVGRMAKMENTSREEIPMFMAILAIKKR